LVTAPWPYVVDIEAKEATATSSREGFIMEIGEGAEIWGERM
jgi:hypothetical protein